MPDNTHIMDQALDIIQGTAPEYSGGLCNHASMAAEAFYNLGRAGEILPWVSFYRNRLYLQPPPESPISEESWKQALGDFSRFSDWVLFFSERIKETGWTAALRKWAPLLAPGSIGGGAHGLIRTAHAARSLCHKRTAQRKTELAQALAYWASRFQKLPGSPSSNGVYAKASEAIRSLPLLPEEKKIRFGLISRKLQALDGFEPFSRTVNMLNFNYSPEDLPGVVSSMTEAFCAAYLASVRDAKTCIVLIHSVTLLGAIRILMPFLDPGSVKGILRYGWQAAAAIYCVFGNSPGALKYLKINTGIDGLIDQALETGDEHAIKFTDACLKEYAFNPEPVYLAAALDATERLGEISKFIGKE
jgi:hypothetical protein